MATSPTATGFVPRAANGSADYSASGGNPANSSAPAYTSTSSPGGGTQINSVGGGSYTSFPSGTTTANISSPSPTTTTPAQAVVTSTAAQNDLTNKQNQVTQLNNDTTNHQAIVAAGNLPPAPTGTYASDTTTPTSDTNGGSLDDQVNDILSSFGTDSSKIESDADTKANALGDQATAAQTALDTAAVTALSQLKAIASGAYPLSPAESSLLNATASGYQQAIQYQTQANASYTGQMTEAMASLGIDTSAPTEAIGLIHAAISSGTSKITDLNGQMATSLANLQLGFQKQDYAMVQDSWDETSKYMEDRISTLTTMQKQVTDAAHQQVTDLQSQTKMNLDAIVQSATFDQKTKQDMIDNAFKSQQITETQRHDLQSEATEKEKADTAASEATLTPENGAAIISSSLVPGATWTNPDTGNVEQVLDPNGKITVDAFRAILAEAPKYKISGDTVLKNYGQYLATDKKGNPLPSYGLDPTQIKVFTGVLPPTS